MLPAVSNRLTRPEPIQYHELLVEHCGTLLHSARLAEGGEFLRHTSEPDFEDHAPSAKEVQARQRVGNDMRRRRASGVTASPSFRSVVEVATADKITHGSPEGTPRTK